MAEITIVFDFDRTIIDDDSDRWVVTQMGLTRLFNELYNTMPWTSLMDRMMEELHLQGRTPKDISECLKSAILHPRILAAIKSAHALGCELIIISDANQHYIETIMEHHGVLECFSQISTNPTSVVGEGRLRISPFHALESPPHGCHLCPPNLCKGHVMEKIRASRPGKQRFIYLGDGRGDFCPAMKLKEGDFVMPRVNYPLWERIRSNSSSVSAQVHHWSDGVELERILLDLIDAISTESLALKKSKSLSNSFGSVIA